MRIALRQLCNRTGLLKGHFLVERDFSIGCGKALVKGVSNSPCTVVVPRYILRLEDASECQQRLSDDGGQAQPVMLHAWTQA